MCYYVQFSLLHTKQLGLGQGYLNLTCLCIVSNLVPVSMLVCLEVEVFVMSFYQFRLVVEHENSSQTQARTIQ